MTSLKDFSAALANWLGDEALASNLLTEFIWRGSEDCRLVVSDRGKVVACSDLSGVWAKLENSVSAGVNLAEVVH